MPTIENTESIAVICASIAAVIGIRSWRTELHYKNRYELAEETLILFYQAKDAISAIRSPFGWSNEGQSRESDPSETSELKNIRNQAYAFFERHEQYKGIFSKLHALRYRFMAVFSLESAEPFNEIHLILNDILHSAKMWRRINERIINKSTPQHKLDVANKSLDKYENVFWEGWGEEEEEEDKIAKRVDAAIQRMETICKPILSATNRPCWHMRLKPPTLWKKKGR